MSVRQCKGVGVGGRGGNLPTFVTQARNLKHSTMNGVGRAIKSSTGNRFHELLPRKRGVSWAPEGEGGGTL
jgi:hypothetical protein